MFYRSGWLRCVSFNICGVQYLVWSLRCWIVFIWLERYRWGFGVNVRYSVVCSCLGLCWFIFERCLCFERYWCSVLVCVSVLSWCDVFDVRCILYYYILLYTIYYTYTIILFLLYLILYYTLLFSSSLLPLLISPSPLPPIPSSLLLPSNHSSSSNPNQSIFLLFLSSQYSF